MFVPQNSPFFTKWVSCVWILEQTIHTLKTGSVEETLWALKEMYKTGWSSTAGKRMANTLHSSKHLVKEMYKAGWSSTAGKRDGKYITFIQTFQDIVGSEGNV